MLGRGLGAPKIIFSKGDYCSRQGGFRVFTNRFELISERALFVESMRRAVMQSLGLYEMLKTR